MKTFLIDDDYLSNYITEKVLTNGGFSDNITCFLSAEEALSTLKQGMPENVPDVIFLDLNMPGMNGWGFLEALEPYKSELADKCHIYILTSSLILADTDRAKDYELVSGLIHKPLDREYVQVILSELQA